MFNLTEINNFISTTTEDSINNAANSQISEDNADFALALSEYLPGSLGDDVTVLSDRQVVANRTTVLPEVVEEDVSINPVAVTTTNETDETQNQFNDQKDVATNIAASIASMPFTYVPTSMPTANDSLMMSFQNAITTTQADESSATDVNLAAVSAEIQTIPINFNVEFSPPVSNEPVANTISLQQPTNTIVEQNIANVVTDMPNAAADIEVTATQSSLVAQTNIPNNMIKFSMQNMVSDESTIELSDDLTQQIIDSVAEQSANVSPTTAHTQIQSTIPNDPATIATKVSIPVQDSDWGDAINQKIQWLTSQQVKSADIQLTPQELGPIRAEIQMQEGITTITLHAHHAEIREALEQNLVKLNQLFYDNGMELPQVTVAGESHSEANMQSQSQHGSSLNNGENQATADFQVAEGPSELTFVSDSLVDYYA